MENIFQFTTEHLGSAMLALLPALLNLIILIFLIFRKGGGKLSDLFIMLVFCLFCWQIGDGMVRLSSNPQTAEFWYMFAHLGMYFSGSLGLHFVLHFIHGNRFHLHRGLIILIYLPSFILFYLNIYEISPQYILPDPLFGWKMQNYSGKLFIIERLWVLSQVLAMLILLAGHIRKHKHEHNIRNQSILITAGIFVPFFQGAITHLIIPLVWNTFEIPLTSSFMTVFTICIMVAFARFQFLDLSRERTADMVLENIQDVVGIVSAEGKLMYLNRYGKDLMGIGDDLMTEGPLRDLICEKYRNKCDEVIVPAIRNRITITDEEFAVIGRDGASVHMKATILPFPYVERGNPLAMVLLRDYSEARASVKEQIRMREKFKSLADTIHEGFVFTDKHYKIRFVNQFFCDLTGYRKEDLIGISSNDCFLLSEEDKLKIREATEKTGNGFVQALEIQLTHKNGHKIPALLNISALKDQRGNIEGWIRTVTDVTELKRSDERLRLFKMMMDQSEALVYVADYQSGTILDLSQKVCQISGKTLEDLKGKNIAEVIPSFGDFKGYEELAAVLKEQKKARFEYGIQGESHRMDAEVLASYIAMGEVEYVLFIARDVTERKKTALELQDRNKDLSNFLYRISHDLLAPVATSLGIANLAKIKMAGAEPEHLRFVAMIHESLGKLYDSIKDLNTVLTLRDGKNPEARIDFDRMVRDVIDSLATSEGFSEVDIRMEIGKITDYVADPSCLRSIFQNLIQNSIKYRGFENPEIWVRVWEEENQLMLEVKDNGIGIRKELQGKVFEMFSRATRGGTGSGLGLYIVKSAVDKLGGEIRLESEPGEGTTMTILLPFRPLVPSEAYSSALHIINAN